MITHRQLLKINLINKFRIDTTYFTQNVVNLFSALFFTLVQVTLIEIIFSKVGSIGGFGRNEVLLQLLVGQFAFYFTSELSFAGAANLEQDINKGALDYQLVRPLPQKFHLFTRNISIVDMLRNGLAPITTVAILINWSELTFTTAGIIGGLIVFVLMFFVDHMFTYILAMSTFWSGSSHFVLNFFWANREETKTPFDLSPNWFRFIGFVFSPAFIQAALAVGMMLGRVKVLPWLYFVVLAVVFIFIVFNYIWSEAMKVYTSASS